MEAISQIELANFENVSPPRLEKSNFRYSFSLLPHDERTAINSIYAFCSYIDDIVDSNPVKSDIAIQRKKDRLALWEDVIDNIYESKVSSPLLMPLIAVINRFAIPKQYLLTLIDGCRRDLTQYRYRTFNELKEYCYGVASVVGLISIEIFGHKYEETKNYAINLGYALQLTNILRDVKADKNRGYIYLPLEDMETFGYSENDLMNEVYNEKFVELMRFQAQRVREYFHKARTNLHPDERITVFSAEIMDEIYFRLLEKIELNEFRVFDEPIRVSSSHKLWIAFKHWISITMFVKRLKKHL